MAQIKINNITIGTNSPPFIVAEAGINHNGDINKAFEMIKVAKKAGVNAIKFQTFKAEEFIVDEHQTYTYMSQGNQVTESMIDIFKRCEFTRDEWFQIKKKCDKEEIIFLSTPQNYSDLELLLELDLPAIKVGSDDFTNIPLLKKYSSTRLPLILSCGMANLDEIFQTLNTIGALHDYPTILLLTTSQYPTPPNDVNLRKLETLAKTFPNLPLGFSDHTQGYLASSIAVAFGACFFEKHFTLANNLPGPDHWFSEEPIGLKNWVDSIKNSFIMMGESVIKPTKKEEEMKCLARRSVVALRDIMEGEIFDSDNIGLKRPGTGLTPSDFEKVIGMKATRKISKGTLLKLGDFS